MPMTSRKAWVLGLAMLGLGALVGQSQGQNAGDSAVRRTNNATAAAPTIAPATIGTIDMNKIFEGYKKVKFTHDQLNADAMKRQGELNGIMGEMKQIAKELEGLAPGTNEFQTRESKLTEMKASLEAKRELAQGEFARREAEALATIYKEVQAMTEACAKYKGFSYVLRIDEEPPTGADPRSVMAAMARSVVYADPSADLTEMVVANLNKRYEAASGATTKPATTAPAQAPAASEGTPKGQ